MAHRLGRVDYHSALEPEKWADMAAFLTELAGQGQRGNADVGEVMRQWRQKRLVGIKAGR